MVGVLPELKMTVDPFGIAFSASMFASDGLRLYESPISLLRSDWYRAWASSALAPFTAANFACVWSIAVCTAAGSFTAVMRIRMFQKYGCPSVRLRSRSRVALMRCASTAAFAVGGLEFGA